MISTIKYTEYGEYATHGIKHNNEITKLNMIKSFRTLLESQNIIDAAFVSKS